MTPIERISIPSSVSELVENWCAGSKELNKVTIMPNNKIFRVFEDKLVIRKSDPKSDIYDILVFANRDIKEMSIPPFIKCIEPYSFSESKIEKVFISSNVSCISANAFDGCMNLECVEFSADSELQLIDSLAFSKSKIGKIRIPNHVSEYKFY